jgi:hypothetical protein
MDINIKEIQTLIVEGVEQKHFDVVFTDDKGETGKQLLVLSGDALKDPKAAFLDGYNRKPVAQVVTEPQPDLSNIVQQQQAIINDLTNRLTALENK